MADFHSRIAAMKGKLTVLLVVVGINAAATLAVFGTLWQLISAVGQLTDIVAGHR